ncbi:indoleamine 2,3-dioxygenase 2 isoform X4 [Ovis aries]|uniref:indoleamine 2,3-dioxygenase 2 isoform X4 n=1 Tax=Ovis aries TaxID=9940 RepID=UPI001C2EC2EA|nr:indoleamine 2,3-dioxygenase 2 isoform X4 [Ovis aries]
MSGRTERRSPKRFCQETLPCPSSRSPRTWGSLLSLFTRTWCWPTGLLGTQEGKTWRGCLGSEQMRTGPLEIRNLDTIFSFPGGESLRGFILVTVLVEKAAVPGIKALVQAVNAILQPSPDSLLQALQRLRVSIQDITGALGQMHDYVNPDVFYSVIRIFLSGWKDNPALPVGLVYEGVSKEPLSYSGGSAAQSTILHAFDEFLGVRHSKESADFLHRMRDYMPPSHRAFVEEICRAPSLRTHVLSSGNGQLLTAYNQCVESLAALRTYHLALVTKYLITAPSKAKARRTSHLPRPPQALEERGTGGSAVVSFLKSVRDKTLEALLHPSG